MRTFSLLALCLLCVSCGNPPESIDVSMYDYRDTRDLVRFVNQAAQALGRDGLAALEDPRFSQHNQGYVYVYDNHDVCLFHAGMPDLVGQDVSDMVDIEGKPIAQLTREALNDPENPHGWIHYMWWTPGKFYPVPKSSCHFKATLPDGRDVYVGGGLDYPHEEREFIRIAVDSAIRRIEMQQVPALPGLSGPHTAYAFRDIHIFAFRPDGTLLISPVLGGNRPIGNLVACTDDVGNRPFERAIERLETESFAWQIFMARNRSERQLVKKIMYLRRTILDDTEIYVGAITDLPLTP